MSSGATAPTWEGDPGQDNGIRHLFTEDDINCMKSNFVRNKIGTVIELDSYDNVKLNAIKILGMVKNGRMPPDDPWKEDRVALFQDWIDAGFPKG